MVCIVSGKPKRMGVFISDGGAADVLVLPFACHSKKNAGNDEKMVQPLFLWNREAPDETNLNMRI